jgi:glycosyl transferase family 4
VAAAPNQEVTEVSPAGPRIRAALVRHQPDIVHLASPVVLGAHGAAVARRLGLPAVAVYQTDLPSYARAYHLGRAAQGPRAQLARVPLGVASWRSTAGPVRGRGRG